VYSIPWRHLSINQAGHGQGYIAFIDEAGVLGTTESSRISRRHADWSGAHSLRDANHREPSRARRSHAVCSAIRSLGCSTFDDALQWHPRTALVSRVCNAEHWLRSRGQGCRLILGFWRQRRRPSEKQSSIRACRWYGHCREHRVAGRCGFHAAYASSVRALHRILRSAVHRNAADAPVLRAGALLS